MSIATPGVLPASVLVRDTKPDWLKDWARFADLPAETVDRALLVLLDCLGVIGFSMAEPGMRALASRMAALGGSGQAPLVGSRFRAAPGVASINGTAGTMLELDRRLTTEFTP